jgi:hypothetical protein
MRRVPMLISLILVLAACGGGADPATGPADGSVADGNAVPNDTSGGEIVDRQSPGQAAVTVDGLDLSFSEPGALACSIAEDAITFSFRIGDNEVTLGGGANHYEQGWVGGIQLVVANPDGESGPVTYFPDLAANGGNIAIDGSSMSYSGPMMKQPPNDGTLPSPEAAGDGVISATCP